MSLSQISSNNRAFQASETQAGVGQLRNGFRHLLQFIRDGHLADAQQAYNDLSKSMPDVFRKLSSKLTDDFDAIGRALREGDMAGAQRAVVQLKEDLQDIGPAGNLSRREQGAVPVRNSASAADGIIRSYRPGTQEERHIGTRIDIVV